MREKKQKWGGVLHNKSEFLRTFMFLFCFIFILLLTYIVGSLLYTKDNYVSNEQQVVRIDPDEYFKNCQLLEKECLDIDCKYYSRCGDGNYQACRIYDCNDTYGIFTEDLNNKQNVSNQPKPDMEAIIEQKNACAGSMQVLSKECVAGKEEIKVKITTQGECKIGGFAVIFDGAGTEPNTFKELGDNTYAITALACGNVTQIVPATPNGISLEF